MGGTVTSRGLNTDAREKMLKIFKNFIKNFKISTTSDVQIVPQLIEKLKQAGMETEANVINQIQEICPPPCPSAGRRTRKKQVKDAASTYLQELGIEESDILDNSKLLKTLQSIIKVPRSQGFWRLVSKSADKADPAVANPFFGSKDESDYDDDAQSIQMDSGPEPVEMDFMSVISGKSVKTPQDDDWTFEDIEETAEAEEARTNTPLKVPDEEQPVDEAPKQGFGLV